MTPQDLKTLVKQLEFFANNRYNGGPVKFREAMPDGETAETYLVGVLFDALKLINPIAEGKAVIVPVEPTAAMIVSPLRPSNLGAKAMIQITKEQIEELRSDIKGLMFLRETIVRDGVDALCDMALALIAMQPRPIGEFLPPLMYSELYFWWPDLEEWDKGALVRIGGEKAWYRHGHVTPEKPSHFMLRSALPNPTVDQEVTK
jgi:hypothetical protein